MATVLKHKVGDVVLLSNSHTRFGKNSIPDCNWGKECRISGIDVFWSRSDNDEGAYYIIAWDGRERHVIGIMLSEFPGPW